MRSRKQKLGKGLILLLSSVLLSSCATPPDVPACTAYAAPKFYELLKEFRRLCKDDFGCAVKEAEWVAEWQHWSPATDSGTCTHIVSNRVVDVDRKNPYFHGREKIAWPEIMRNSGVLPAKIGWAPLKTYIQTQCHDSKKCGQVGQWESTLNSIDSQMQDPRQLR